MTIKTELDKEWTEYYGNYPSPGDYHVRMSGRGDIAPASVVLDHGVRQWSIKGFEEIWRDRAIRGSRIIAWKPLEVVADDHQV